MERFEKPITNRLKFKYSSLRHAASQLGLNYSNLSRIANGKPHELETHIKILIGLGDIPNRPYIMPKEDMQTFRRLNERKLTEL
jgi:hypothetical protein